MKLKMKLVQQQQLQLNMKFLLDYNMKVAIYFGEETLMGGGIFSGGGE